jgi:hypothetical protein
MLTNTGKSLIQLNRPAPEWLPIEVNEPYNRTDLTYDFCLRLFGQIEAAKREKIPVETMRQWFIEFIRKGWTKKIVKARYEALLDTKIYGIDKLEMSDWVNAVQVYGHDEINILVQREVERLIARGNYLRNKKIELSDQDKQAIDLAEAKQAEFKYLNNLYDERETYQQERKRFWEAKFNK